MIAGMFNRGALPVLERVAQYTEQRQKLIAHNIANFSTPHFRAVDVSPEVFQGELRDALADRRRRTKPNVAPLRLRDSRAIDVEPGRMRLNPSPTNRNILFHDRNNRDLERTMQDLAENQMAFSAAIDMLRSEFDIIRTAIRERVS